MLAQLAVEAIFLEAALAVLRPGADKLTERQAAALEGLAFDWIVNAERYIESRFHELLKCRDKMVSHAGRHSTCIPRRKLLWGHVRSRVCVQEGWCSSQPWLRSCQSDQRAADVSPALESVRGCAQVVESCAVMLGALSEQRLMPIVTRLLREMCDPPGPGKVGRLRSDAPSARQEIFQMCRGMKRVRLPLGNASQVCFCGCTTEASHGCGCISCSVKSQLHIEQELQPAQGVSGRSLQILRLHCHRSGRRWRCWRSSTR